jgi:hypothetical protein
MDIKETPTETPTEAPVEPAAEVASEAVSEATPEPVEPVDDTAVANPIMEAGSGIKKKEKKINFTIPEPVKQFFAVKKNVAIVAASFVVLIACVIVLPIVLNKGPEANEVKKTESENSGTGNTKTVTKYYDNLTGELVSYSGTQYNADGSEKENENGKVIVYTEMQAEQAAVRNNQKRINCIQISNEVGARPQVGLNEAKIVYEMPIEGGITRFSAVFRGASSNMIGPVGFLRKFNYEMDRPYDCTFVFNSGESSALDSVKRYSNFSEANGNMWRDLSTYLDPNNVFTSANKLDAFNRDDKNERSEPKTMPRMSPEDSAAELKAIRKAQSEGDTSKYAFVSNIYVHMSVFVHHNVNYVYNASTNSYTRTYESGEPHVSYTCKNLKVSENAISPSRDCGQAVQLSPKVVVVLKTEEDKKSSNKEYETSIATTGSGEAWVFQNGIMINGTWERKTTDKQFVLKNTEGEEIKLAPGQTFVSIFSEANGFIRF